VQERNQKSVLISSLILLLGCAIGMCNAFWPTLTSSFTRMQADPIDTRFNQYILEHTFHCITQTNYVGTLWSPPFFYPTPNVLAYSDNLLGSAPIYWLARFAFNPDIAYSLWMIACTLLCFITFASLGHRLHWHPILIATGSMLFAFGLHRSRLINHQQLLPQFFTPLAIWAAWESIRRPRLLPLTAFLTCVFLQLLCGIYLGYFLIISLFLFIPIFILIQPKPRPPLAPFIRRHWLPILSLTIAFIALSLLTFHPYLSVHHSSAGYLWTDVQQFLPTFQFWLPPWKIAGPISLASADFSTTVQPAFPFAGFAFLTATIFTAVYLLRPSTRNQNQSATLGIASFITAIVLMLLTTRWPNDLSAWKLIYLLLPGSHGIRAVSRIDLLVFFYLTLAVMIALDLFLKTIPNTRSQAILTTIIATILITEQCVTNLPSFDTISYRNQTTELSTLIKTATDAAYLADYFPPTQFDYTATQITAMQAGLTANKPIINGYSGWFPPNYTGQLRPILPTEMPHWLAPAPNIKSITIIAPRTPGLPLDWAESFPVTAEQSSEHFVAITLKVGS
jgi:hypothetical protein